jgi:hypothetical protein
MNGDSDREIAIFTAALKVPRQERDAFLELTCGADEELRRRLEALLRAYDGLGSFLEEPPTGGPSL